MTLIKRYAEGFLEYAKDTIGLESGLEELQKTKDVLRDNADFKEFLENPSINYMEKGAVIDNVFAKGFSREIRDFLKLLLKKDRIEKFTDIAKYARIKYIHGDKVTALLYTSYLVDTEALEALKGLFESKFRVQLQLYINLDPDMLGGVRLIMGNKVLDGSVRKRLENLKQELLAARVG